MFTPRFARVMLPTVAFVWLLTPTLTSAGPIISTDFFDSTEILYGESGLHAVWDPIQRILIGDEEWSGSVSIETGTPLVKTLDGTTARYEVVDAVLTVNLKQPGPGGIEGQVTATLLPFFFDVDNEVDAGGFRSAGFFEFVTGGPSSVSPSLRHILGGSHVLPGSLSGPGHGIIGMDSPEGYFVDDEHLARAYGQLRLEVPEPSTLAFMSFAAAFTLWRRRFRS